MTKKRPFLSTTIFSTLGRMGGLAIPFFIAMVYGASPATDAFFFAYGLIFYLIGIFTHIFEASLIPYLAERKERSEDLPALVNAVLWILLPVVVGIGLIFWLGLHGFFIKAAVGHPEFARRIPLLFLELMPLLVLSIWISAANGIFYMQKIFWLPAVSPIIRSLTVIIFIFVLNAQWQIQAVTVGFVVGEFLRWGLVFFFVLRWTPFHFRMNWQREFGFLTKFFREASLQIFALVAINTMYLTDQWFAAWLGPGNLSLMNYADRLFQIPYLLFVTGFLHIFLSDWSDSYQRETAFMFWPKVRRDVRKTFLASLSLGLCLWFFRSTWIQWIYGHGDFSAEQLRVLSEVFGWLGLALIPLAVYLLYGRLLFVLKKSGFYCLQSWMVLAANVLFNYMFALRYGVKGIAISTALVYFLMTVWLHFYLKRYWKEVKFDVAD